MDNAIILNFKTYEESTGDKALRLARICDDVARETGANIIVVPQVADIYRISREVSIPVYAQHIDNIGYGSNTGHVLAESVKSSGAKGSLLNHSEMRLKLADIEAGVERLRALGMTSIVCTNNINTTRAAASLNPDFVAIEPPELIGTGVSVSRAQPEIVSGSVDIVKKVNPKVRVLCGAGITEGEDVRRALELGTCGVLLASGVVKAKDPRAVLMDLIKGLE
ncbi:MAG TPA: triose-phosphate isomerase [Candidatus Altiarchaeales archaeon]|nr:triose-phosphate isomerase [Candidatus Altiarchaeales archaeon]